MHPDEDSGDDEGEDLDTDVHEVNCVDNPECCPEPRDYDAENHVLYDRIANLRAWKETNEFELKSLSDGRCTANMLFVEALKEHKLAIEIVDELITMSGNFDQMTGQFI